MTDSTKDHGDELVLDWDDAVESFRLDLEEARAESAPFPQRTTEAKAPDEGSSASSNEVPTLPPQASSAPPMSDPPASGFGRDSLSIFETEAPPSETRVNPLPPPRVNALPPPRLSPLAPPPLPPSVPKPGLPAPHAKASPLGGGTLAGLAPPVRAGEEVPGGLFVQQTTSTLRPGQQDPSTSPPGQPAPHEEQPTRPSAPSPRPRPEPSGMARMYAPPTPEEAALLSFPEEDDSDATQVAAIPRELLDALLTARAPTEENNRVTERPPAPAAELLSAERALNDLHENDFRALDALLVEVEPELEPEPEASEPTRLRALPPEFDRAAPALPVGPNAAPPSARTLPPAQSAEPRVSQPAPAAQALNDDLDALLPPIESKAPGRLSQRPRDDRGAKAAQTTVGGARPQVVAERASPLDDDAKRARIALLSALANKKEGRSQALLWVSAAELSEELADLDAAKERYLLAHAAAPTLLAPIWALARLAFEAREVDEQLAWLRRAQSAARSPREKARALAETARIHWLLGRDTQAARAAAQEAARLCPDDLGHRLLALRLAVVTDAKHASQELAMAATSLADDHAAAVLLSFGAKAREQQGARDEAERLYSASMARAPNKPAPRLGLARVARARGNTLVAGRALAEALPALGDGLLARVARRHATVLLATAPEGRADALALGEPETDAACARTAFAIASRLGDPALSERARTAWMHLSEGRERALAHVAEADQRIRDGQHEAAARALEEALGLDRTLSLARVLWELLARESGELTAFLKRTVDQSPEGVFRAAAKLACEMDAAAAEAELLATLTGEREVTTARSLRRDAFAEAGDVQGTLVELEALAQAAPAPSLLLTWADVLRRTGADEAGLEVLRRAVDRFPDDLSLTRALVRTESDPSGRVRALLFEAAGARGARAAFLQLLAGHMSRDPSARLAAFERAYEALPGYAPAVFALHTEVRRQNEIERLTTLHTRESARAHDPQQTVTHLVRAALVRAHADGDAAAAMLTRALDLAPSDPVLRELVIRLGDAVPASLRAEALQRAAERASPPFARAALLSAAGAFEDAGQAERALDLYEQVLRSDPDDPIAEMGRERVAKTAGRAHELLELKRRAIHEATTEAGRVRALEDLLHADSDAPADESLDRARALLVLSPRNPLALRRTERHAMERGDLGALVEVEQRLLASSFGGNDKLARLHLLGVLTALKHADRSRADELDQLLLEHAPGARVNLWIARQIMGAALASGDEAAMLTAIEQFTATTAEPVELASLAVRRARLTQEIPAQMREERLNDALAACPDHPTGLETLADLREQQGDLTGAAETFERAALDAVYRPRAARLWSRAGRLYERLSQLEKAKAAYLKAVAADISLGEAEERLRAIFTEESNLEGLATLIEARLSAGATQAKAAELHVALSQLHERRGDLNRALESLRKALEEAPEELSVLRELARLLSRESDARERAQVLLRLARISRDPQELRDVFMQLGAIYDGSLPDAKRAEAAYQRALKLSPRHAPALERLAALYSREGEHDKAEECLARLVRFADTDAKRFEATLEIARGREARSDMRGAEEVLEDMRRSFPIAPQVLRALSDFYRRGGAGAALAMHLNRSISDLRSAVERDPKRGELWLSLVETLEERHRPDAARVTASAAIACGVDDPKLRALVDESGDVPGVFSAALSELLDDLVFSADMPPSTRLVFRHGAEALNRAAPFDLRSVGGERLDRKHPLRKVVQQASRAAGIPDAEVFTTRELPLAFVPVSDSPAQLLVGQALLDALTPKEQLFLTARALKIARSHMSITCRVRPEEMALLLHGLIRAQIAGYNPRDVDPAAVEDMARRIAKHIPRKVSPELMPALMELMGSPSFVPEKVYAVASTAGNHAGLLSTGSLGTALSALTKLAGLPVQGGYTRELLDRVEEARDLLSFALSDVHFEARLRAGVELR